MKIKLIGNSITIITDIKLNDIELLEKRNPEALVLKDEDGNNIFRIAKGDNTKGECIGKYGATFSSKNAEGYAVFSGVFANSEECVTEEEVIECFGSAIDKIALIKQQIEDEVAIIRVNDELIKEMIEVE